MKKLTLLAAGFLLAANCVFADPEATVPSQPPSDENEPVYISNQLKLVPHSQHEESAEKHYVLDVTFPQIEGDNLSDIAIKFNRMMSDEAKEEADLFKRYVTEDTIHMQTLPAEQRNNTLNVDYDTNVVKPSQHIIISVRMTVVGMQAGRAHPYHRTHVFNFDLTTGKELTLGDLFKPKSNYLGVISAYSKKELEKKLEDKWMIADGTKPVENNFKNWNIEADNIVITFDEYQVAPYVYGAQEVEIPYSELKKLIAPNSIIAPCVKDAASCLAE
jgi:hypothetical protein